ncbi:hypothetical protein PHLGIDRAFT_60971 [Phlebiopsis gigantea 11061_1 CR5-6]|uniref:Protein-S-isoprenylcysteine O-methyltransferase n=1 Tax=Phlebiopsis gigantea (strain 11061_1 CR5-6) TaxID=745531 RepID=A0A0C3SEN9_PHLG1|nr:hypothetical protein PHLGIDRAFT_60971 [Phlebiopsis gigantea 11061_1 CR5-6]
MQTTNDVHSFEGPEDVLRRRGNPQAQSALETNPIPTAIKSDTYIPNTPLAASIISFLLGSVFVFGFSLWISGGYGYWWAKPQLGFYLAAYSAFHWAEFAVTAGWNREKCSVDSFLLENGAQYHVAHGVALTEYLITVWFKPEAKTFPYITQAGIILVTLGQALRSIAMIHAATNFSHAVAKQRRSSHQLVTDGIYAWSRHPSYVGFFYWALGSQLVLQNSISFVGFVIVLWRFFSGRIQAEEAYLISFFGKDYLEYRSRVGTKLPFIQ